LLEGGIVQDIPPDFTIRTWINENRDSYHKEYGDEDGERKLFAKAWQDYNALNTNNKNI